MFSYKILKTPLFETDKKTIDLIFNHISNIVKKKQKGTINIVFLDKENIKNLNNKYRKINKATDVLSFHYFDDFSKLKKSEVAGEVVICEEILTLGGKKYGLGSEGEFYKILIHSILHILGYDHEKNKDYKTMQDLENKVWELLYKEN